MPNSADHCFKLGAHYRSLFDYHNAKIAYKQALAIDPNHRNANFDYALMILYDGNYPEGFARAEFRLKFIELRGKIIPHKGKPYWNGESIEEKVLLIQGEQGYGDQIMYARYVPLLAQRAKHLVIRTRQALVGLFRDSFPFTSVCAEEDTLPPYDCFVLIASLPRIFHTTLQRIPSAFPYLSVTGSLPLSKPDAKILRVAITYGSSPTNLDYKNKTLSPEHFAPLLENRQILFFSTQPFKHPNIIDISPLLIDFRVTAQFLEHIDLLITCDTAIAHLAGALHHEAWVILPNPSDWRWMPNKERSQWYPSLRLFRQERRGDWESVLVAVGRALEERAKLILS